MFWQARASNDMRATLFTAVQYISYPRGFLDARAAATDNAFSPKLPVPRKLVPRGTALCNLPCGIKMMCSYLLENNRSLFITKHCKLYTEAPCLSIRVRVVVVAAVIGGTVEGHKDASLSKVRARPGRLPATGGGERAGSPLLGPEVIANADDGAPPVKGVICCVAAISKLIYKDPCVGARR